MSWRKITNEKLIPSDEEFLVSVCDETGDTNYTYSTYAHTIKIDDKLIWIKNNEILYGVYAYDYIPEPM